MNYFMKEHSKRIYHKRNKYKNRQIIYIGSFSKSKYNGNGKLLGIVEIYVYMTRFKDDQKMERSLYSESMEKKYMKEHLKRMKKMVRASTTMRMEKKYTLDPSEMVCVMGRPCIIPRERKNTLVCFTEVYQRKRKRIF